MNELLPVALVGDELFPPRSSFLYYGHALLLTALEWHGLVGRSPFQPVFFAVTFDVGLLSLATPNPSACWTAPS
jgi:tellurite resistance protein TehA-like permease